MNGILLIKTVVLRLFSFAADDYLNINRNSVSPLSDSDSDPTHFSHSTTNYTDVFLDSSIERTFLVFTTFFGSTCNSIVTVCNYNC